MELLATGQARFATRILLQSRTDGIASGDSGASAVIEASRHLGQFDDMDGGERDAGISGEDREGEADTGPLQAGSTWVRSLQVQV
jgi:hypothetical protein